MTENQQAVPAVTSPTLLPVNALMIEILSYLDARELCLCSRVNKTTRTATHHPWLWNKLIQKSYGEDFIALALAEPENKALKGKDLFKKLQTFEKCPTNIMQEKICKALKEINIESLTAFLKQITKLNLKSKTLYIIKELEALTNALEKNTSITSIDLSYNGIRDEGAKAIARALKNNPSITSIDLRFNTIEDEGAKAIASALKNNNSITSIDLRFNKIGDEGVKAIARVLEKNTSITSIYLSTNKIGDEGAKAIASAIEINTSITSIDLSTNKIGDEGAKAIASAIEINNSITSIYLSANNIGDEGAKAIASAIEINTSITSIDLSGNSIGLEGAKAIASALENNPSITSINLADNNISVEGVETIALIKKTLQRNKRLHQQYEKIYSKIKKSSVITQEDFDDDLILLAIQKDDLRLVSFLLNQKPDLICHTTQPKGQKGITLIEFAKIKQRTEILNILNDFWDQKNASQPQQLFENNPAVFFHSSKNNQPPIQENKELTRQNGNIPAKKQQCLTA